MGSQLLGRHFDIHGGGQDLQFPHHENEIAQSEGAHQCQFVNYWMHNGFVRVDDEKMSKSLGNFFTIREVLKKYDAEVVRFFILRAHYRSPLNYSDVHLDDARQALTRLYTALKGVAGDAPVDWSEAHAQRFKAALDDDFGTPEAMAVLFDLATAANRGDAPWPGNSRRWAACSACCSAIRRSSCRPRRPAASATRRSMQKSAPAPRRRRRRILPNPTASATNSRRPASSSRTGRREPPGAGPEPGSAGARARRRPPAKLSLPA
jgi:cysteinyl-tRNA synthetase